MTFFFVPVIFAFPINICPSKAYMAEFQNASIVGKCFIALKKKYYTYFSRRHIGNEDVEENILRQ
jgi:hypothetical protein